MITNAEQLETILIFAKNLLLAKIEQCAHFCSDPSALALHRTLAGFGCFRIDREVPSVQLVTRRLAELVSAAEVLREKVSCQPNLKSGRKLRLQSQAQFRQFFYKSLRKNFKSAPMQCLLYFLLGYLADRHQGAFVQHLILYCYGICLPARNPLCALIAAGNYQGLKENYFPVPLLLPSVNMSDGLGLTTHLLGMNCKKMVQIGLRGLDPQVRPLKAKVRGFKLIKLTDRTLQFQPQSWASLIREPARISQPDLNPQFKKFSFVVKAQSAGFMSTKLQVFRVYASDKRLRIDLQKVNKEGVLSDFTYLYKDYRLYFIDHKAALIEEVRPSDCTFQTVLKEAKVQVLDQKLIGKYSHIKSRFQLQFEEHCVKSDYLDRLPLDRLSSDPKSYSRALNQQGLIDRKKLLEQGPLKYVAQYSPPEQIIKQTKTQLTRSSLWFDMICCKGIQLNMHTLQQVMTVLSIQSGYFAKMEVLFRRLREASQALSLEGKASPLPPLDFFPFLMVLHVSTFTSLSVKIMEIKYEVPPDVFKVGLGYSFTPAEDRQPLSSRSSILLLEEAGLQKFFTEGTQQLEKLQAQKVTFKKKCLAREEAVDFGQDRLTKLKRT